MTPGKQSGTRSEAAGSCGLGERPLEIVGNGLIAAFLATVFFIDVFGKAIRHRSLGVESLPDFAVFLSFSRQSAVALASPESWWFYPPPFVVGMRGLALLGDTLASLLWLGLLFASVIACLVLLLRLLGLEASRWRFAIALLAVGASYYFLKWDLKAANVNLITLAVVLGSVDCARRERWGGAGALLALGIAIKLQPALLLPYLACRRQWRWLALTMGGLVVLFVLVPVFSLGVTGAVALTKSWLGGLAAFEEAPSHYKSLRSSVSLLLPERAALATLLQLGWGVAVVAYFLRSHALRRRGLAAAELNLADIAALLLLPLPLSPAFQAPHGVVVLVPAMILVACSFDPMRSLRLRLSAFAFGFAIFAVVKLVPDWPARGAAIMLAFFVALCGLMLVARRGVGPAAPSAESVVLEPASEKTR